MDEATLEALGLPFLIFILLWTTPWKGVALWKAVKNGHKGWFIVMLILNTLAILEITYIFYFSKKINNKISGETQKPNI